MRTYQIAFAKLWVPRDFTLVLFPIRGGQTVFANPLYSHFVVYEDKLCEIYRVFQVNFFIRF